MSPLIHPHFHDPIAKARQMRAWTGAAIGTGFFCALLAAVVFFMALKLPDFYGLWPTLSIGVTLTLLAFGILVFVGVKAGSEAFTRPKSIARRPIQIYYLATPLFFIAEIVFGYSFLAPFLGSESAMRFVYYGFVFGLGVFLQWRPRFTEFIALTENSILLVMLVGDLFMTTFLFDLFLPENISTDDCMSFYVKKWVGFLIHGAVLTAAVLRSADEIDNRYVQTAHAQSDCFAKNPLNKG